MNGTHSTTKICCNTHTSYLFIFIFHGLSVKHSKAPTNTIWYEQKNCFNKSISRECCITFRRKPSLKAQMNHNSVHSQWSLLGAIFQQFHLKAAQFNFPRENNILNNELCGSQPLIYWLILMNSRSILNSILTFAISWMDQSQKLK